MLDTCYLIFKNINHRCHFTCYTFLHIILAYYSLPCVLDEIVLMSGCTDFFLFHMPFLLINADCCGAEVDHLAGGVIHSMALCFL